MKLLEYSSDNKSTVVDLTSSGAGQQLAQRFKLARAAPVGKIRLYLQKAGSPAGYFQCELQGNSTSGGNNLPDGTAITDGASLGTPPSDISTSIGYVDFDFDVDARPVPAADTSYHIVLKASGYTYSDGVTEVSWGADQSSPHYVNGEGETYNGTAWSDISTGTDFCFELYSRRRAVYSSLPEIEAETRHLTNQGVYDTTSTPTITAVMDFEENVSDEIDAWLAGAGFAVPVTDTTAIGLLRPYAIAGTAMYCELTQRTAGFRVGESDTKTGAFRQIYHELRNELRDGGEAVEALVGIGLERTTTARLSAGLSAGHIDEDERDDYRDDTDIVQPLFQGDMWDND